MTDSMEEKDRKAGAWGHEGVCASDVAVSGGGQHVPAGEKGNGEEVSPLEVLTQDEGVEQRSHVSLKEILGGDILMAEWLRRQMGLLLLCVFFIIVYITNRYSSEQEMIEIDKLKVELTEVKYRALTRSGELTVKSRQSQIEKSLRHSPDSLLQVSNEPPFVVYLEEDAE